MPEWIPRSLRVGDVIDKPVRIRSREVGVIDVAGQTRLRLIGRNRFELTVGTIHAKTTSPPGVFVVNTPRAEAVDLGCEYTLTILPNGSGVLRVASGWVELQKNWKQLSVEEILEAPFVLIGTVDEMVEACHGEEGNPGLELGLELGHGWEDGRDKGTINPNTGGFGLWAEQLLAERARHVLADDAGDDVGRSAGGQRHNEPQRLDGIRGRRDVRGGDDVPRTDRERDQVREACHPVRDYEGLADGIESQRRVHRVANPAIDPLCDQSMPVAHLQGDRPVRAKVRVRPVEEPEADHQAHHTGDEQAGAQRVLSERKRWRRDPD